MGNTLEKIKASPNIADTCMAVMALVRSGSTPSTGEYKDNALKAVNFVCGQIEESREKELFITDLRGTRTQMKLGTYIDTFMAAQMLAEIKKDMPDSIGKAHVENALAKVMKKIELNQKEDGRWAGDGWAPVLAQAQASKAINAAAVNGVVVNEKVREAAEQVARAEFSVMGEKGAIGGGMGGAGGFSGGTLALDSAGPASSGRIVTMSGATTRPVTIAAGGDAGVELYSRAAQLASMNSSAITNGTLRAKYFAIANAPTTAPAAKAEALAMLHRFDDNDKDLAKAQDALVVRMQDKQFVQGFGSNGGEEFLSYLNIGESLILKGGDAWGKWDKSMTENLKRVQNDDGSWSGHHCITGRTFCSAAALMVLTIDRSPMPVAAAVEKSKANRQ